MLNYIEILKKKLNRSLFRTPGVEYLIKHNSDLNKKKKYLKYWFLKSKNNPGLKKFFFNKKSDFSNHLNNKFTFKSNKYFLISDQMYESLASNGILVIQNALPLLEREKIISYFMGLKKREFNQNWLQKPKIIQNKIDTQLVVGGLDISNFKILNSYSLQFTQKIYRKEIKPNVDLHYLKLKNFKEKLTRGETYFHSDRFLPHFKIYYSPYKISKTEAPFQYALGSHRINKNYFNFFLNSTFFDETELSSKKIINNIAKITAEENTLYIAFTNGLHKRTIFENMNSERFMLFMQYVERFNKIDYLLS
jgi:hypothetical protein